MSIAAYPPPPAVPTQEGLRGIRFDFNEGCRVTVPEAEHPWRVRLTDLDTGNILYETEIKAGEVRSAKRYFIRFRVEVWQKGESVLDHSFSARDRNVLVQFPAGTLGDTIAWFPYAAEFQKRHGCRLTCAMPEHLIRLFRDTYPSIQFVDRDGIRPESYYAGYTAVLYFNDTQNQFQRFGYHHVGLQGAAAHLFGLEPVELRPRIAIADATRPIAERYVCIAVQSTNQCKYWNNPAGWDEIVAYLKAAGYAVVCIDQKPMHGRDQVWNRMPREARDETGDRPLQERARWLTHAEFYIGLSSGLSWLAWAVGTPVVLISGFTHPNNEFATPYRVINYHTCNSCWNDPQLRYDHNDFFWCPRHKNTPRQFECTRLITPAQVKDTIGKIPGFGSPSQRRHEIVFSFGLFLVTIAARFMLGIG